VAEYGSTKEELFPCTPPFFYHLHLHHPVHVYGLYSISKSPPPCPKKERENKTKPTNFFFLYENENLKHRNGYYYYRKKIENLGLEEQEEGGFVCNSVFKVSFLFWVIVKNRKRETWG
jgi:hypothetical protein